MVDEFSPDYVSIVDETQGQGGPREIPFLGIGGAGREEVMCLDAPLFALHEVTDEPDGQTKGLVALATPIIGLYITFTADQLRSLGANCLSAADRMDGGRKLDS
jgi:hypothetical protein